MQFKRSSDSHTYAVLWWMSSILLNMGLIYYGFTKVKAVESREFFVQTTIIEMSSEHRFVNFPDVLLCTSEAKVILNSTKGVVMTAHGIRPENSWLPTNCLRRDTLTVISTNNTPVDMTEFTGMSFAIVPRNDSMSGNFTISAAFLYLIPPQENPYRHSDGWTSEETANRPTADNFYAIRQAAADMDIRITPKATNVIRKDIWGLFGEFEDELKYSLSSSSSDRYARSRSVKVYARGFSLNETQILITSIPSAFADWGGAFSAAWGFFYFCFGAARLDPFGVITRIMRQKTRRNLRDTYGAWSSDAPLNKSQDAMPTNGMLHSISKPQLLPPSAKLTNQTVEGSAEVTSFALTDIVAEDDAKDVDHRRSHMQGQVQHSSTVEADLHKVQVDLHNLQADHNKLLTLLKDFYLEMDLADEEVRIPSKDAGPWYRRPWSFKSVRGDGKKVN